jgi:hypothetical protein
LRYFFAQLSDAFFDGLLHWNTLAEQSCALHLRHTALFPPPLFSSGLPLIWFRFGFGA